jgi:hypothetical protein
MSLPFSMRTARELSFARQRCHPCMWNVARIPRLPHCAWVSSIISKFLIVAVRCGSFACALRVLASKLFVPEAQPRQQRSATHAQRSQCNNFLFIIQHYMPRSKAHKSRREFRCCAADVTTGMFHPQLSTKRNAAATTHSNFLGVGAQFATPA